MSPALASGLIVTLAVLLALVSALAGALWWRVRTVPWIRVGRLAQELAERQAALDELLKRFELSARKRGGPVPVARPSLASLRLDPPQSSAVSGPTLIAVPNLAASPAPGPSAASAELARRFGAIWELADAGASPDAIARTTGHPVGQVELILGLRRQIAAAEGRS
jgi:hypothetical protein